MDDKPRIIREHEVKRHDDRPIISIFTPVFRTFISDVFHGPFDYSHEPVCAKIELNLMRCLEAYGGNRGFKECRDFVDDYRECTAYDKQKARIKAMRAERRRQHKAGERPIKYSVPPRMGSYESTEY